MFFFKLIGKKILQEALKNIFDLQTDITKKLCLAHFDTKKYKNFMMDACITAW